MSEEAPTLTCGASLSKRPHRFGQEMVYEDESIQTMEQRVLLQQTVRRGNLSSPEVEEDKIRCPQGLNDGWVAPTNKVSFRYSFAEMKESVVPAAM